MIRKYAFILLAFVCLTTSTQAQAPVNQLVAWFPFDSAQIFDASLNGSVGTAFGSPFLECGVVDKSVLFDGQDDALLFLGPVNDLFDLADFTVSFYFKPISQPGTQLIMAKQDYAQCSPKPAFWVRYSFNSNSISTGIFDDQRSATVSGKLDENKCWQLVTIVRRINAYEIYINGQLKGTTSTTDRVKLKDDDALLHIGEPVCPTDRWMRGYLDDLRFYKRALSLSEIGFLDMKPDQLINSDTIIFLGNDVQTVPTRTCAASFQWSPINGVSDPVAIAPRITPTESGSYKLSFLDQFCVASDTFYIKVIDPATLDCSTVFIPNAFTPGNSVGRNDRFGISNPFAISEFISFEVYDRWGGRMFNGASTFDQWDGNFNGQPVNAGSYLYKFKYKCQGEEKVKAGNVIVVR
jgi:gliding motility-associated-like protein